MKASNVISIFSKEEKAFVLKKLKLENIQRFLKAFNFIDLALKKGDGSKVVSKSALYFCLFGQNYSKQHDHQLRNDLRQLNLILKQHILDFLRTEQKLYLQSDEILWLNWILSKEAFAFFEKEWRATNKEQKQNKNYAMLVELGQLYSKYLNNSSEISLKKFQEVNQLLDQVIHYKKMMLVEEIRQLEILKNYSQRVIKAFDKNFTMATSLQKIELTQLSHKNPILYYFYQRGQSFLLNGKQKIKVLKEIIDLHPEVVKFRPEEEETIFSLLGAIALEYFLQDDFKEADVYYEMIFKRYKKKRRKPRLDIIFNYISNLFKSQKYEQAIELILKNYRAIKQNTRTRYRIEFFLVLSYLQLGENENAYRELHINIHKRPENEFYNFQLCYLIYYYQTHQLELFRNKVISYHTRIQKNPPLEKEYTFMALAFNQLMQAIQLTTTRKRNSKLKKLQSNIRKYEKELPTLHHFSVNSWMKKEVEGLLG